jgi:hypothetical protein
MSKVTSFPVASFTVSLKSSFGLGTGGTASMEEELRAEEELDAPAELLDLDEDEEFELDDTCACDDELGVGGST